MPTTRTAQDTSNRAGSENLTNSNSSYFSNSQGTSSDSINEEAGGYHKTHRALWATVCMFWKRTVHYFHDQHTTQPNVHSAPTAPQGCRFTLHTHTDNPEGFGQRMVEWLHHYVVPHLNYYKFHLSYFIFVSLFGGALLCALEGISYIDGLFIATSAMTNTGLITADFSRFNFASQLLVWCLIFLGGQVFMSLVPPLMRRYYFKRGTNELVKSHPDVATTTARGLPVIVHVTSRNVLSRKQAVEYHALNRLVVLVACYLFGCVGVVIAIFLVYAYADQGFREFLREREVSPVWFAFFFPLSAFNNAGFSLLNDSVISFRNRPLVLILMAVLVILGYTGFPMALRAIIKCIYKYKRNRAGHHHEAEIYQFMLCQPRKIFTHLFTRYLTWFLLLTLLLNFFLELGFFVTLDWNSDALKSYTVGEKTLSAFFQSSTTRTAGFNVVELSLLNEAMLVLYIGLMYVSAYPVVIPLRLSNEETPDTTVFIQTSRLLLHDLFWIFLAWFLISTAESPKLRGDLNFTVFKILFEIVSGFGTVGLSIGYPRTVLSFAGQWSAISKLILCAVMLLGRHRGLPDSVDRAIQIPDAFLLDDPIVSSEGKGTVPFRAPAPLERLSRKKRAKSPSLLGTILG